MKKCKMLKGLGGLDMAGAKKFSKGGMKDKMPLDLSKFKKN